MDVRRTGLDNTGKSPLASLLLGACKWTGLHLLLASRSRMRIKCLRGLWFCVLNRRYLDIGASIRLTAVFLSPFLYPWIQPSLASYASSYDEFCTGIYKK